MAEKIGIPSGVQSNMRECSNCRGYTDRGYFLQRPSSTQFVCEDCYEQFFREEYPLAQYVVQIPRRFLDSLFGESEKISLKAGYLLGRVEQTTDDTTITVDGMLPVSRDGNGYISFFTPADHINIKKNISAGNHQLVGLYRTIPGGECVFNALDQALVMDMRKDLVYIIIAGKKQGMVSGMSKRFSPQETGVVIV